MLPKQIQNFESCRVGQGLEVNGHMAQCLLGQSFHFDTWTARLSTRHDVLLILWIIRFLRIFLLDYLVNKHQNTPNTKTKPALITPFCSRTNRNKLMNIKYLRTLLGSVFVTLFAAGGANGATDTLATVTVTASSASGTAGFEGVVEAIRQTTAASQVAGRVTELRVKPGDSVKAGQVLVRLEADAAEQTATSSDAMVQAAKATLELATQEYERKQKLVKKDYISQAAFERAEAQYRVTKAQVSAQIAQANAAHTQTGFYVVTAPYAGIVSDVPVALGDMALPGKPLVTLYDPQALRVTAYIPQTAMSPSPTTKNAKIEIPGRTSEPQWLLPSHIQALPSVDPITHKVEVRFDIAHNLSGVTPGEFARVWLPVRAMPSTKTVGNEVTASASSQLLVPVKAIVRRAELTGIYVVDEHGHPILRQVRLGERREDKIEVLSGVSSGDHVALDPQAAANVR